MKTRGRDSAAKHEVIPFAPHLEAVKRPEPLPGLTKEQQDEWRAVVKRLPAEWFPRETHQLLATYCCHVSTARFIADQKSRVEAAKPFDIKEYNKLCAMAFRESVVIANLATKMRLSQQSSYDKTKMKPSMSAEPWDDKEEA